MKFHLSSLLLIVLVAALGIGWYLNSTELERDDLVGCWESTSELFTTSHSPFTKLEIHQDGTFYSLHGTRNDVRIFRGTYVLERFGMITFTITSLEYLNEALQQMHESIAATTPGYTREPSRYKFTKPIEASITCHGSIDAEGILKLETRAVQNPGKHPDKELPVWGSFKKRTKPVGE